MTTFAVDTSVLLPALVSWHPGHEVCASAIARESDVRLPAHVYLETFSVLTRLPAPSRFSPESAEALMRGVDVPVISLPGDRYRRVVEQLAERRIGGGSVYDALIGATAATNGAILLTRDLRAARTYDAVGAQYQTL